MTGVVVTIIVWTMRKKLTHIPKLLVDKYLFLFDILCYLKILLIYSELLM